MGVIRNPQDLINITLVNRKGEGRWCALRLIYGHNLFCFGGYRHFKEIELFSKLLI